MKQYQVVIVRMSGKGREDEDSLTDLLNERTRMGWNYESLTQLESDRVAVVFERGNIAAGLAENAKCVLEIADGPCRLIEYLNQNATDVVPDPLVED